MVHGFCHPRAHACGEQVLELARVAVDFVTRLEISAEWSGAELNRSNSGRSWRFRLILSQPGEGHAEWGERVALILTIQPSDEFISALHNGNFRPRQDNRLVQRMVQHAGLVLGGDQ